MSFMILSRKCIIKKFNRTKLPISRRYSIREKALSSEEGAVGDAGHMIAKGLNSLQSVSSTRVALEVSNFPFDLLDEGARFLVAKKLDYLVRAVFDLRNYKQAAAELNVSLQQLGAHEYAAWHLREQQKKSQELQLCDHALNSQSRDIEHTKEVYSILKQLIPENHHDLFNSIEAEALITRAQRKQNEYEFQFNVAPETYDTLQKSIVPSMLDLDVTPEEYVDFCGGEKRFFNTFAIEIADSYDRVINARNPQERLKYQDMIFVKLDEALLYKHEKNLRLNEQSYEYRNAFFLQKVASDSISRKLNRRVRFADFDIESRFRAGAIVSRNPLLDISPRVYFHGRVEDVSNYFSNAEISFREMDNFNPPSIYRTLTAKALETCKPLAERMRLDALNFPMWEESGLYPRNSAESLISFKLWRLYNVLYPELGQNEERQLMFGELFDISPGELTLEWTLSYPPQEHTFSEELPLWVTPWEDDELTESVSWPRYDPSLLRGRAKLVSNEGGLVKLKFEPPTRTDELRSAVKAYLLDRANLSEYQDLNFKEQISKLTPADLLLAQEKWSQMSPQDRREVEDFWDSPTVPLEDDSGLRSPRILNEVRHLSAYHSGPKTQELVPFLEDYSLILPDDEDIKRTQELYQSLLRLNSDYMSAGGIAEIFNGLSKTIQKRLDLLGELQPLTRDESSNLDAEKILFDQEALLQAAKRLEAFLASDRYQELAQMRRTADEAKDLAHLQDTICKELEPFKDEEVPMGVYRIEKPISELTETEKVFAVIADFEQIARPIRKIVPNDAILDWSQHLFRPLEMLQKKLHYALERRVISIINENRRPSGSFEVDSEQISDVPTISQIISSSLSETESNE